MADPARFGVFDGAALALPTVTLAAVPPATRFSLRARGDAVAAAGRAFGVALPVAACRSATADTRAALWLGPDEWLLLAEDGAGPAIEAAIAAGLAAWPHSLVEIGHRLGALELDGADAATALNAACPLDLDAAAFPVGMCTRTVFAKAEIVLWRTAENRFRIEVARSFGAYVRALLEEACREFDRPSTGPNASP
jgi:sarcosine oxidase subunit gamma